jgi:acyl CoA:acetate/3-ketoacid CoA transferase alpha subunit
VVVQDSHAAVAGLKDGHTVMVGGFGGAIDLAVGARAIWVMMDRL